MKPSIITYSVDDLLHVCITRKKVMYAMLQNSNNADFQRYLFKVLIENHLCFQNIHFTIADNADDSFLKTFQTMFGLSFNQNRPMPRMTISQFLENERKSLQVFETSLHHFLPMMVHLIIKHEVKCLHSSVIFLENFSEKTA